MTARIHRDAAKVDVSPYRLPSAPAVRTRLAFASRLVPWWFAASAVAIPGNTLAWWATGSALHLASAVVGLAILARVCRRWIVRVPVALPGGGR